jgi:hypothetical protein
MRRIIAAKAAEPVNSRIHCPMVVWPCGETTRDSSRTRGKEDDQ